jgi:hypothetical protein
MDDAPRDIDAERKRVIKELDNTLSLVQGYYDQVVFEYMTLKKTLLTPV